MTFPRRRIGSGFEALESRTLPTSFGIPWADPGHLTLSFAPDGTPTPRGQSNLTQTLSPAGSAAQREILRAFQTWASVTNVNIGVVPDGGLALGSTGAVQGDGRFGDVRVAGAALTDDVLASASPFHWSGSTFAGDLILNSTESFRVGPTANSFDLYSVTLHEAGHVFGLDHSNLTGSALSESYAYRTSLSADDIAAMQRMYGVRSPDANEGANGNDTASRASSLRPSGLFGRVVADGDLSTLADVDHYKFSTLPTLGLTSVTVRLQAEGLSLVTPRVTVLNSAGQIIAQGASSDPMNNDVELRFPNAMFGGTFTVKVEGLNDDVFGIGSYRLTVDTINLTTPVPLLNSLLDPVADGHLNDVLSAATDLTATKTDARFDATFRGVIEDRRDVDNFKVRAPASSSSDPTNLNVMVWGTDMSPLGPRVRIHDAAGAPVAYRVMANEGGLVSIEVDDVTPGATYFVSVAARNPAGNDATGDYFLGADFNRFDRTTYDGLGSGTVQSTTSQTATFHLTDPGIFQFALASTANQPGGGVTMTVQDSAGRVVFSLDSMVGQPLVTTTTYLTGGNYTIRYTYRGTSSAPVQYHLYLLQLSEDVGPYATKTNNPGGESPPPEPSGYEYDSASSAPPPSEIYYF